MSESLKPRFAVDLSEIERQLAQQGTPAAQPASATRNDPLAELARIVGQEDPFQAILSNDGSAPRPGRQASSIDDLFAVRPEARPAPQAAPSYARRAGADPQDYGVEQYPQPGAPGVEQGYDYEPRHPQGQHAYGHAGYSQDYYDDGAAHQSAADYGQPEYLDYPPVEKPRSRKGLIAIGAVLGATLLGAGGAYMLGGGSSNASGGEPPLIKASNEPVKVEPQNPGGVEIPNQNKQIYERAQNSQTKVVNREEQPVDVGQTVRMNSSAVADASGAVQPPTGLNLGEPRKVRTVTIRPDGSVVGADNGGSAQAPAPAPVPAMTMPAAVQPAPAAPAPVASPVPQAMAGQVAPAQPKPAPSTPVAAPVAPAPKPVPAASTPASGATPQQVASAQPTAVAVPAPAAEQVAVGGYSVQLGLANSESGAESALAQYQRKYPDLEGLPPLIRKAELNGNTIFRVRVGPLSREEASSLCSKLQGQGGQCFVAKN